MKRRHVHELHSVEVQLVVQLDDASESRLSHEGGIFLALGDDRDGLVQHMRREGHVL